MLKLQELMACHGIEIDDDLASLLMDDLNAVIRINESINLTRISSEDAGVVRHLEDSLLGLKYLNEAPEGRYGDLGTGGGFPGIPLAIMTGRETVLIDSVQKKINALLSIVDELGLSSRVSGYAGRIEDLAVAEPESGRETVLIDSVQKKINALLSIVDELGLSSRVSGYAGRIEDLAVAEPESFSALTARALSSLPSLMELASPLLSKGGYLICYKAKPEQEETDSAIKLQKRLGLKLVSRETFTLTDGSTRCFFVFEKVDKPKVKLPRRVGMAQRNPLSC